MRARKVCHLTSVHTMNDIRIFGKECTSLAKNGFDVTLIACNDEAYERVRNDVKQISLKIPVRNRLIRMIKRSRAVYRKALAIDASIYHFHDPELIPVGLRLKRKGKIVIFDSHEFYGEQIRERPYLPHLIRKLVADLYMKYETFACKKFDAVIQICTLGGRDYFLNRVKRMAYVRNTPLLSENGRAIDTILDKNKSIAYIGCLAHSRGITHLLKASYLADTRLVLCGEFAPSVYQQELMKLPEYSVVDYRGYIPSTEVTQVLGECFVGVSTLLHVGQYYKLDTMPTKVYEYMKQGIPVIISNTPFAQQMVDKFGFGICVDPTDITEISNAIQYLIENPSIANEMGLNGQKVIQQDFNWSVDEKLLINLYRSLK